MYYKVVVINSIGKTSYNDYLEDDYRIYYEEGVETFPKVARTKLFVCDNLEDAAKLALGTVDTEIWECEVTNPVKVERIGFPASIVVYWESRAYDWGEISERGMTAPSGTCEVDSIKLTKRIK